MNIAFYYSAGSFNDPIINSLVLCFRRVYNNAKITLIRGSFNPFDVFETSKILKNSDRVFIWNGSEVGCFWVKEICKTFSIPYCVFERGLFPQSSSNFIVDREGICCRSESIQEKYLNNEEISDEVKIIKNHYQKLDLERLPPKDKYVFVFQLEFDSTVYHYGIYNNNEEMVDAFVVDNNIDINSVVICPHPRNRNIESKYKISNKPTIKECQDAKLAVGISSTTMYEILGMGCPVEVLGGNERLVHPINREWTDKSLIIPCILQNQFDISDDRETIRKKINQCIF